VLRLGFRVYGVADPLADAVRAETVHAVKAAAGRPALGVGGIKRTTIAEKTAWLWAWAKIESHQLSVRSAPAISASSWDGRDRGSATMCLRAATALNRVTRGQGRVGWGRPRHG